MVCVLVLKIVSQLPIYVFTVLFWKMPSIQHNLTWQLLPFSGQLAMCLQLHLVVEVCKSVVLLWCNISFFMSFSGSQDIHLW